MKFIWIIATCASMILALLTSALFPQASAVVPICVMAMAHAVVLFLLEPPARSRRGRRIRRVVRRVDAVRPALVEVRPETRWQPAVVLEPAPRVEIVGAEQLSDITDTLVRLDGWARGRGDFPELAAALGGAMSPRETCRAVASLGCMIVAPHERDAAVWALGKLSATAVRRCVMPVDVSRICRAFGDADGVLARFAATYGHSPRSLVVLDVRPFKKPRARRRPAARPRVASPPPPPKVRAAVACAR